jgi:alpha-beta hydrolase superfamily lysophospholipase
MSEFDPSPLPSVHPVAVAREYLTPGGRRRVLRQPKVDLPRTDLTIEHPDGKLAVRTWGEGQPILLVHGWAGDQSDMFSYVPALTAAGFRVVTLDLPAHGESSGEIASLEQLADGILAVARHFKPLKAIVGHSVGSAASAFAISKGLAVERAVLLAPPESYENYARYFAAAKGLKPPQVEEMIEHLLAQGVKVNITTSELAADFRLPGLIVHSSDDQITAAKNSQLITRKWSSSRFLSVSDLGHRGVLRDQRVISAVCDFLLEG